MPVNIEKILKELGKGTPQEQYETLANIKQFITENLAEEQAKHDELATKYQSQIDKLNGNT